MCVLFPLRVALAVAALVQERRKRMDEQASMKADEDALRRRVRDEATVGMYSAPPQVPFDLQ